MHSEAEEVNGYLFKCQIVQDNYRKYICTVAFVRAADRGKRGAPENRRKIMELFDTAEEALAAGMAFGKVCAENHQTGIPLG